MWHGKYRRFILCGAALIATGAIMSCYVHFEKQLRKGVNCTPYIQGARLYRNMANLDEAHALVFATSNYYGYILLTKITKSGASYVSGVSSDNNAHAGISSSFGYVSSRNGVFKNRAIHRIRCGNLRLLWLSPAGVSLHEDMLRAGLVQTNQLSSYLSGATNIVSWSQVDIPEM